VLNAITYRHKGHAVLIEAFREVAAAVSDVDLVLSGGVGPFEEDVQRLIERSGLNGRVRRVGRIPRTDVDGLLDGAVALAFPSHYEGFGLPTVEAMARGCPVLAADATALPEVVADAGMLLPPDDASAWRDALFTLLGDEARRAQLVAAGRARVTQFSAVSHARALAEVYRRALAS
jgi:alpha-1,3-rhamnosyl/mannosyltransferase